jgi:hypothetical protein
MFGAFGKSVGPGVVGVESRQTGLRQIYARNAFDSWLESRWKTCVDLCSHTGDLLRLTENCVDLGKHGAKF